MTRPADRTGPGVRVTALPDERASTGRPLALDGRVLTFTYEDTEMKADKVALELDNFDLSLFDSEALCGGAVLEVSWGYPGSMAAPRRVVVRSLKGFQRLTVEGQATSVLMNREAKTRSWAGKSRSDVVREVAGEYGFEGDALDVEDTCEGLDTINQAGRARGLARHPGQRHGPRDEQPPVGGGGELGLGGRRKKRKKEPMNRSDALGAAGPEPGRGRGGHVGGGVAEGAFGSHRAQTSSAVGAWVSHGCSGVTAEGEAGAVRARAG